MTSKKSSVNPFRFTFLRTCSKNWLVPLAVFLLTGYTFFVSGFVSAKTTYTFNLADGYGKSYLEDYKFQLSDDSWGELGFLIDILLIIASVVLGISIFRYMFSKKSVNVYYSLGMTRANMFLSKYLAGAFLLVSSALIPIMADVIGNIALFGSSKELWISAAYLTASYLSMLLYSYSITVAVCCCVGTLLEAGFFSIIFIGIPLIAENLIEVLFSSLLYGSPYGRYSDFVFYNGESYRTSYGFGITSENILFFSSAKYDEYSYLRQNSAGVFNFKNPHLLPLIIMLAVIILASFAAFRFYKKRKTEIAGFIGANKVVTHIGIFTLSVFGFSFISEYLAYLDYSNGYRAFLFAAVSVLAVYTVIQLVSLRSIKLFFKTIWKMPVHFALLSVIIVVFTTGLFGYSSKIPEKSQIERIAITTGTGDSFFGAVRNTSRPYDFLEAYMPGTTVDAGLKTDEGLSMLLDGYGSEEEIDHILSIHQKFIDIKDADTSSKGVCKEFGERTVLNTTRIIYTLKDGSKFERHYNFANDEITRMLAELTRTELYKKNAVESLGAHFGFTKVYDDAEYIDGIKEAAFAQIYNPDFTSVVSIASPNFSSLHTAPALNVEIAKTELYEALKEDIMADRLPLNFNTESPVKGYIYVMDLNSDIYISPTEEEAAAQYSFHSDNAVINATDAQIVIPVYESMTSTLAVIENYNCISLFENAAEPVTVETWKFDENAKTPYLTERATLVEGIYINKKEHLMNENFERFWSYSDDGERLHFIAPRLAPNSVESSNPVQVEKFSNAFRMISLDCYDGYYVRLIFDDGSCVYGYAPCSLLD